MIDIGPTIAEQLALDPFAVVIGSVGVRVGEHGLLAIHTTSADLYVRLWVRIHCWLVGI